MMQLIRWYQDVIVTKIFIMTATTSEKLNLPSSRKMRCLKGIVVPQ